MNNYLIQSACYYKKPEPDEVTNYQMKKLTYTVYYKVEGKSERTLGEFIPMTPTVNLKIRDLSKFVSR